MRASKHGPRPTTMEQKFWRGIAKSVHTGDCWMWSGVTTNSYGKINLSNTKQIRTHRASWMIHYGEIPEGMSVLHKCDVRPCVNPSHLFLGTHQDNMTDMKNKGRLIPGKKKLNEVAVMACRCLFRGGVGISKLADIYDVAPSTIYLAVHGINWSYLPGAVHSRKP